MDNPTTQQQSVEAFVSHFLEGAFSKDFKGTFKVSYPEIYSLQRFYNRLYLMDMKKSLKPILPQMGATLAFAQAAQEIWAQQQTEIDYLSLHHPQLRIEHSSLKFLTLKVLETRHILLNEINKNIIIEKMGRNRFIVNLELAHITRFSMNFFQEPEQSDVFEMCRIIHLGQNQITLLDLKKFINLEHLWCRNNQLVALCTQGLENLQLLDCSFNPPLHLNIQGCSNLKNLFYQNTSFLSLMLRDVPTKAIESLSVLDVELAFQHLSLMPSHSSRNIPTDAPIKVIGPLSIQDAALAFHHLNLTLTNSSMETDKENEVTVQTTESQTAATNSSDEQLLLPHAYFPSLENRLTKRKRVPDTEGPQCKKRKKNTL